MIKNTALGLMAAVALFAISSGSASAQTCAQQSVTGIGKASRTNVGARLSSRHAWRRAVINRRGLGLRYAVLSRAKRASHSCRPVGKRTLCRYTATPCRT